MKNPVFCWIKTGALLGVSLVLDGNEGNGTDKISNWTKNVDKSKHKL